MKKRHLEILGYRVIQVWNSHLIHPLNRHGGVGRARHVCDPRDGWLAGGFLHFLAQNNNYKYWVTDHVHTLSS